ncbi:PRPF39, related protein [Toxoplasma gondii TgCatPRC2]|uniref:PRPF39, related protein n=1 Tax=Toxoplasma gondii TgCatPRC2 TaxID=1130821 RepID=A0A151HG86_TOXGO|nr:PRPF39, related protein [Toxoplasma gondii TgCatPRC2]
MFVGSALANSQARDPVATTDWEAAAKFYSAVRQHVVQTSSENGSNEDALAPNAKNAPNVGLKHEEGNHTVGAQNACFPLREKRRKSSSDGSYVSSAGADVGVKSAAGPTDTECAANAGDRHAPTGEEESARGVQSHEHDEDMISALLKRVDQHPHDYEASQQLVTALSHTDRLDDYESALERILSEFPLLFGYWKKLGKFHIEKRRSWPDAERVLERACEFVGHNPMIWVAYLEWMKEACSLTKEATRVTMDKAVDAAGLHWKAWPMWQAVLDFDENEYKEACGRLALSVQQQPGDGEPQEEPNDPAEILRREELKMHATRRRENAIQRLRLVYHRLHSTPLESLDLAWERFKSLLGKDETSSASGKSNAGLLDAGLVDEEACKSLEITDLLTDGEMRQLYLYLVEQKHLTSGKCVDAETSATQNAQEQQKVETMDREQIKNAMASFTSQHAVDEAGWAVREKLFAETALQAAARQVFEKGVHRWFWHPDPLTPQRLQAWRDYLDFEDQHGTLERRAMLRERCLEVCASYLEFWQRFAQQLIRENKPEEALKLLHRGAYTVMKRRRDIAFAYAMTAERLEKFEEATQAYNRLLEPPLSPVYLKYYMGWISFQRRRGEIDRVLQLYDEGLVRFGGQEQCCELLYLQKANFILYVQGNVSQSVNCLSKALTALPKSVCLLQLFIRFLQIKHKGDPEKMFSSASPYFTEALKNAEMTAWNKWQVWKMYVRFLEAYAPTVAQIQDAKAEAFAFLRANRTDFVHLAPKAFRLRIPEDLRVETECPSEESAFYSATSGLPYAENAAAPWLGQTTYPLEYNETPITIADLVLDSSSSAPCSSSSSPSSSSSSSASSSSSSSSVSSPSFPPSRSFPCEVSGHPNLFSSFLRCLSQEFVDLISALVEDYAWIPFEVDFPLLGLDSEKLEFLSSMEYLSSSWGRLACSPEALRRLIHEPTGKLSLSFGLQNEMVACPPPEVSVSRVRDEPEDLGQCPSVGASTDPAAADTCPKYHRSGHGETAQLCLVCDQKGNRETLTGARPAFHTEKKTSQPPEVFVSPKQCYEGGYSTEKQSPDTAAEPVFYSPTRWPSPTPPCIASSADDICKTDCTERDTPHRKIAKKGETETVLGEPKTPSNGHRLSSWQNPPRVQQRMSGAVTALEYLPREEPQDNRGNGRASTERQIESRRIHAGTDRCNSLPDPSHAGKSDECAAQESSASEDRPEERYNAFFTEMGEPGDFAEDGNGDRGKEANSHFAAVASSEGAATRVENETDRTDGVEPPEYENGGGQQTEGSSGDSEERQRESAALCVTERPKTIPVSALFDIHVAEFCRGYRHAGAFGYHNFKKASEESFSFWEEFVKEKGRQRVWSDSEESVNDSGVSTHLPHSAKSKTAESASETVYHRTFDQCGVTATHSLTGSYTQPVSGNKTRSRRSGNSGVGRPRPAVSSAPNEVCPPISMCLRKSATAFEGRSSLDTHARKEKKNWRYRCGGIPGLQALGATWEEYTASRQWMFRFCSSLGLPEELVYISVQLMHFLLEKWADWQPSPRVILPQFLAKHENSILPRDTHQGYPRRDHLCSTNTSCTGSVDDTSGSSSHSSCFASSLTSSRDKERMVLRLLWGVSPAEQEISENGDPPRLPASSQKTPSSRETRTDSGSTALRSSGCVLKASERMKTEHDMKFPYPLSPLIRLACVCIAIAYKQLEIVPHLDCGGVVVQAIVFTETEEIEARKERENAADMSLYFPKGEEGYEAFTRVTQGQGDGYRLRDLHESPEDDLAMLSRCQETNADDKKAHRISERVARNDSCLSFHMHHPVSEAFYEECDTPSFASVSHTQKNDMRGCFRRSILAHPVDLSAGCCACCQYQTESFFSEEDSTPSSSPCSLSRFSSSSSVGSSRSSLSSASHSLPSNGTNVPEKRSDSDGCAAEKPQHGAHETRKGLPTSEGKRLLEKCQTGTLPRLEKPAQPLGASVSYRPWPPTGWLELYAWSCMEQDNLLTHANSFLFLQWLLGACKLYRRRYGAAWLPEESEDEQENEEETEANAAPTDDEEHALSDEHGMGTEKAGRKLDTRSSCNEGDADFVLFGRSKERSRNEAVRRNEEKSTITTFSEESPAAASHGEDDVLSRSSEGEEPQKHRLFNKPQDNIQPVQQRGSEDEFRNPETTISVASPENGCSTANIQCDRFHEHSTANKSVSSPTLLRCSSLSASVSSCPCRPSSPLSVGTFADGPPASLLLLPPCPPSASLPVYLLQLCLSSPDAAFLSIAPVVQAACVVRFLLLAYQLADKHMHLLNAILGPRVAARVAQATKIMKRVLLSAVYRDSLWRWRLPASVVHALLRNMADPTCCERCIRAGRNSGKRLRQSTGKTDRDGRKGGREKDGTRPASSPCSSDSLPRRAVEENGEHYIGKDQRRERLPFRLASSGASHGERKRLGAAKVGQREEVTRMGSDMRREMEIEHLKTKQELTATINRKNFSGRTAGRFQRLVRREHSPANCSAILRQERRQTSCETGISPIRNSYRPFPSSTSSETETDHRNQDDVQPLVGLTSSSMSQAPAEAKGRKEKRGWATRGTNSMLSSFSSSADIREVVWGGRKTNFSPERRTYISSTLSSSSGEDEEETETPFRRGQRRARCPPFSSISYADTAQLEKGNRFQGTQSLKISPHCRWSVAALLCPHGKSRWDLACPECHLSPSASIHRHFAQKSTKEGDENSENLEQKPGSVRILKTSWEGSLRTEIGKTEWQEAQEKGTRDSETLGCAEGLSLATKTGLKAGEEVRGRKRRIERISGERDLSLLPPCPSERDKQDGGGNCLLKPQTKRLRRWDVTAAQLLHHAKADEQ